MNIFGTVSSALMLVAALVGELKDETPEFEDLNKAVDMVKQIVTGALGHWPSFISDELLASALQTAVSFIKGQGK